MDNFKQSKEYAAIIIAQYDAAYDIGVEENFFNIWKKRQDVDYRLLGPKLRNLMVRWLDEEKEGILDTRPPPSPKYPEAEEDDEVLEVAPPIEVPAQALPADTKEEEIVSNPLHTKDKPVPITLEEATPITLNEVALVVLDEAAPINLEEEEPTTNNDPP